MRVSDYIFKRLKEKYGVDRVFMITGGGAMHLNDAVLQSGLAYTCCHPIMSRRVPLRPKVMYGLESAWAWSM